jgi:hypothetical protein
LKTRPGRGRAIALRCDPDSGFHYSPKGAVTKDGNECVSEQLPNANDLEMYLHTIRSHVYPVHLTAGVIFSMSPLIEGWIAI